MPKIHDRLEILANKIRDTLQRAGVYPNEVCVKFVKGGGALEIDGFWIYEKIPGARLSAFLAGIFSQRSGYPGLILFIPHFAISGVIECNLHDRRVEELVRLSLELSELEGFPVKLKIQREY